MEHDKIKHFMYVPFTGLGLYGGFRGNRWLRNRIKVFKSFVVPSLINQTNQNFTLWIGWRPEERGNPHVEELKHWLDNYNAFHFHTTIKFDVVFTYGGLCFWDDKFEDAVAKERLATNLHLSIRDLVNLVGDVDHVLMTIQPSDDCYHKFAVNTIQQALKNPGLDAFGFTKGYICNYATKEISEYNPKTNPPFYTIKFKKSVFLEPQEHIQFAPIKSHEYVANHLRYGVLDERGFLVGTHGENVSTYYNHPFKGEPVDPATLDFFGIADVPALNLPLSLRKKFMRMMPYKVQRKLRYWFGELMYNRFYEWLRN